jgi:molecular chaperone DnaK
MEGSEPVVIANSKGRRTTQIPSWASSTTGRGEAQSGRPAKQQAITNPKIPSSPSSDSWAKIQEVSGEMKMVKATAWKAANDASCVCAHRRPPLYPQEISAMILQK